MTELSAATPSTATSVAALNASANGSGAAPTKGADKSKPSTKTAPSPKKAGAKEGSKESTKEPAKETSKEGGKKITLVAKKCPSKAGTNRAKRWAKLKNGMTVAAALDVGIPKSYLNRMQTAGHLKIA